MITFNPMVQLWLMISQFDRYNIMITSMKWN